MDRQGMKLPLLIGGATTSRAHTAVKISPAYREPVVHVLDASRAVPVTTSLLRDEGRAAFVEQLRVEDERLRRLHDRPRAKLVPLAEARKARPTIAFRPEDVARPDPAGVEALDDFPLATLREYIDWSPLFHTWELKGLYPAILQNEKYGEQARQIFADANALLDRIVEGRLLRARGVWGIFPAASVGDDVEVFTDASRTRVACRFCFLRQQVAPHRCLAEFVAPREAGLPDHLGAFAVTTGHGLPELCQSFRARHDDYTAIMAEALADRLAEAFAEHLHERARRAWGFGNDERLSKADLIAERYRGIRPAPGYPACPDHTEKGPLWSLLDVEARTGMRLTESFAMWPGSSVSGLYFAHPEARYFGVGKIDRDQVVDYHLRKGMTVAEVERWLGPSLGYDPLA
jgi:5-methyltetrahydrofolate--homocysteine methyltransferase